jgi:sulfate adenylyltransferase
LKEAKEMIKIRPFTDFIYDAEQIGIGSYSPLKGFMDQQTLNSVITQNRLWNGLPWTIPIILAPAGEQNNQSIREIKEGEDATLLDWNDNPFAILHATEKFSYSKEEFARGAYGTTDTSHPNVHDIYNNYGDTELAGKSSLIRKMNLPTGRYELTPRETKELFKQKGWHNVVAYQCRNPPHTAHEYIQRCSLEIADID